MPCRRAKPSDRTDDFCCGCVTGTYCTLKHTGRLTRSGRSPSFPSLDRLGKVRWTRARDGPIGWRAGLGSSGPHSRTPMPRRHVQPYRIRSASSRRVGHHPSRGCDQVRWPHNEPLLIEEASALSKLPACQRLPDRRVRCTAVPAGHSILRSHSGKTLFHVAPQHIPP